MKGYLNSGDFKKEFGFLFTITDRFLYHSFVYKRHGKRNDSYVSNYPLICLIISVYYGVRNGFDFLYILSVAVIFTPLRKR